MTLASDSLYAVNEVRNNRSEPHTGQVVVISHEGKTAMHSLNYIMYIGYYTHSTCTL